MLPGFRFLLATVVLAVSVLVFGLGAAALLRAAHEEFASLPSWRLAQQPLLAPQFEMSAPTLAMLRMEAPVQKTLMETVKPQVLPLEAPRIESMPVRLEPIRPEATSDIPEAKPAETATPSDAASPNDSNATDDKDATARAEQSPPPSAPTAETITPLNAQASIEAPAATARTPAEEPGSGTRPAESNAAEVNGVEPIQPELIQPQPAPVAVSPPKTEASEPTAIEAIASTVRSSEATAADPLPDPVAKKAKRPSARTIARRRHAIARARAAAAARERSRILLQQQGHNPDPFTQIFSGGNARPG